MGFLIRPWYAAALASALLVAGGAAQAAGHSTHKTRPAAKHPAQHQVKGQGQLAGGNGRFGQVYSLQNGFNFEILSARYMLDPFLGYGLNAPHSDEKNVTFDIALKNATPSDNWFNDEGAFTLVDDKGQLYPHGRVALASKGSNSPNLKMRPGQGLGQPALKDPLRVNFIVPGKARIVKFMVNQGRLGLKKEEVFRYYIAGATKEEAGEAGDPKNIIAPLPEAARDPSDPSGAAALPEGKGTTGVFLPTGCYDVRLDSFAYATDAVTGNPPDAGKRFAVATVTAKNPTDDSQSMFNLLGGDFTLYQVTDADGERYRPTAFLKAHGTEEANHKFEPGDVYTFRIVFQLPKDAQGKKLILAAGNSYKWAFDISNVK